MKYSVVVFEGNDCSGKTTLKKAYDRKFGFRDLCIDRMFVSGLVYNKVKNRNLDLENDIWQDMFYFIEEYNAKFIYVKTAPEIIWKRINTRGNEDIVTSMEEVVSVCTEYDNVFNRLDEEYENNLYIANGNAESIDAELERIHEFVSRTKRA